MRPVVGEGGQWMATLSQEQGTGQVRALVQWWSQEAGKFAELWPVPVVSSNAKICAAQDMGLAGHKRSISTQSKVLMVLPKVLLTED